MKRLTRQIYQDVSFLSTFNTGRFINFKKHIYLRQKLMIKALKRLKIYIGKLFRSPSPKEVREPTTIERRSTCPLCIGYEDKIENPDNDQAPTKDERISRRKA